eukprot:tig00000551_g2043.t1
MRITQGKMSTAEVQQVERAFQKQDAIFIGSKRLLAKKGGPSGKVPRYYRNIGLGFKTPREAIEAGEVAAGEQKAPSGSYIDKKCPFTGNVSIRGRILQGVVQSTKMKRTLVVRRDYMHFIPKYNRYEKRHKNFPAHCSPAFIVNPGDTVIVGQCRPLSKTVRFNVLKVIPKAGSTGGQAKKAFQGF